MHKKMESLTNMEGDPKTREPIWRQENRLGKIDLEEKHVGIAHAQTHAHPSEPQRLPGCRLNLQVNHLCRTLFINT